MKVEANLTFNKIRFDQEFDAHLVVSLTAPEAAVSAKRPRLCIVPLLDVSPSMAGLKLDYAKRSLSKLIDHLSPADYCGLVKFSRTAETVAHPIAVTAEAKEDLKRKVAALTVSGSTNIADALLTGLSVANNMDLSADVITRVILFTDGEANVGPAITPADILNLLSPNIGIASVSAFAYGDGAQQEFLGNLAKQGGGNYAYVQNPDDALSAFGKELGGLLSTYATNLVIDVSPLAGHQITQIVSDVDGEEEDMGQVTLKIPDILTDETRHIILGIKLKEQKNAFPRPVNVLDVRVDYDILDVNSRKERKSIEEKVKAQFVKAGEEQAKADPVLDRIVGLAQIVRAQIEAEEHAKSGNFVAASGTMASASAQVKSRGLVDLGIVASNVGNRMGSPTQYAASSAYLTSFTRGATRGVGVASYDAHAADDLKSLGLSLSNTTQSHVSDSFANDHTDLPSDHTDLPSDHTDLPAQPTVQGMPLVSGGSPMIAPAVWGSGVALNPDGASNLIRTITGTTPPSLTPTDKAAARKGKRKIKQKQKSSARW